MQPIRLTALFLFVLGLSTSVLVEPAQAQLQLGAEAKTASDLMNRAGGGNSAQNAGFVEDVDRKSPRDTIASFVAAMTSIPNPNYDQAYECMAFSSLASVTKATKQRLANDLLRVIGHVDDPTLPANIDFYPPPGATKVGFWVFFPRPVRGNYSVPAALPPGSKPSGVTGAPEKTVKDAKEYAGLVSASRQYRVKLAKDAQSGAWQFVVGPQTAQLALLLSGNPWMSESIESSTQNLTMTIGERIQWSVPTWMLRETLGLRLWQWVGIASLLGLGILLDLFLQILMRQSARVIRPLQDTMFHAKTLNQAAWPTGLAAAAIFWGITVHWLALPPASASVIALLITIFAVLCSVWAGFRIADLAGEVAERKAEQEQSVIEDLTVPIVRKTIKLAIVAAALIIIAWEVGATAGTILAALGIVGAGIMLASKDVLAHYFGSITLVSTKPFDVGDWVVIGDVEGTVEELGFRATKIRTFRNTEVTIPNANLIQANIDNYGRRQYRRWKTCLNLPFETPTDLVESFCEGIRELVRIHPHTRKDYYQVWLNEFGPDSLQILLYIFFETPDWESELRERNRMALDIMRLAEYLGLAFSLPAQEIQFGAPLHDAAGELDEAVSRQTDSPPRGSPPAATSTPPRQAPLKDVSQGSENPAGREARKSPEERPTNPSVGSATQATEPASTSESPSESLGEEADRVGRAAAAAITANAPWRKGGGEQESLAGPPVEEKDQNEAG